jgi:hypothetical protein
MRGACKASEQDCWRRGNPRAGRERGERTTRRRPSSGITPLHAAHVSGSPRVGEAIVTSGSRRGGCNTLACNVVVPVDAEDSTAMCTITTRNRAVTFFGSVCDNIGPYPYCGRPTPEGQLACRCA